MSKTHDHLEIQRQALLTWLLDQNLQALLASLQSISQAPEWPPAIRSFAATCRKYLEKNGSNEHPGPWAMVLGRLDRWMKQCIEEPSTVPALDDDIRHLSDQLQRWAHHGHRFWAHTLMSADLQTKAQ